MEKDNYHPSFHHTSDSTMESVLTILINTSLGLFGSLIWKLFIKLGMAKGKLSYWGNISVGIVALLALLITSLAILGYIEAK